MALLYRYIYVVCYQRLLLIDLAFEQCTYLSLYKAPELQCRDEVCCVTEVSTFTQVSSGLKRVHILIFSKCKYFHVKVASLATVKSCVTVGPIVDGKCLAPCMQLPWISSQP